MKTEEICSLAVSKNGLELIYVPDYLKTEEICKIAVYNNSDARKYVPAE